MKITVLLALFISCTASAQNWQEWTKQKKTQIKYLLQQIAANKVYIEYAQKGYSIASNGLQVIRTIKDGDFRLHHDFFESHRSVNPKLKDAAKVAAIIALQLRIVRETKVCLAGIKAGGRFTAGELDHCVMVFGNLLNDCLENIESLFLVITSGELSMTDDERLHRIDELYSDMQSKYGFCSSFSGEMNMLSVQRLGEQIELQRSKKINGLE